MFGSSRLLALGACLVPQGVAVHLLRPDAEMASAVQFGRVAADTLDQGPLREMGPLALASETVGVRLPGGKESKAWGDDKIKAISAIAVKDGAFETGIFNAAGTSEHAEETHLLYGAGYKGLGENPSKLPSGYGVVGAVRATPGSLHVVNAMPSAKGGLDYSALKVAVSQGHLPREQLPWGKSAAAEHK
uniref:Uncharacterized protein n=1 Tax=Alexandrium catenella TaxID=2925 RepID=A0A7S1MP21_ALECA|mmetsp:Transcript_30905/g.83729  ORF Transcript_30905/g.83729 Transcript_30905/m.83729 type:complete len:189 (+) Transcript_30905:81-647(+)